MAGLRWRDPEVRRAFEAYGGPGEAGEPGQLAALLALSGDLSEPSLARAAPPLTTARTRRLYRLQVAGHDCFVKLQIVRTGDLAPKRWPSFLLRPAPPVREERALDQLAALGVAVPEVLAAGSRGRWPGTLRAALITRAVPGHMDLEAWLTGQPDPRLRTLAMDAAEALLERIHAEGWSLGGASYRNLLVPRAAADAGALDPAELVVLDQPNLARLGAWLPGARGAHGRARDARRLRRDRGRFA